MMSWDDLVKLYKPYQFEYIDFWPAAVQLPPVWVAHLSKYMYKDYIKEFPVESKELIDKCFDTLVSIRHDDCPIKWFPIKAWPDSTTFQYLFRYGDKDLHVLYFKHIWYNDGLWHSYDSNKLAATYIQSSKGFSNLFLDYKDCCEFCHKLNTDGAKDTDRFTNSKDISTFLEAINIYKELVLRRRDA